MLSPCRGRSTGLHERERPILVDRDFKIAGAGVQEVDDIAALLPDAVDCAVPVVPETVVIGRRIDVVCAFGPPDCKSMVTAAAKYTVSEVH